MPLENLFLLSRVHSPQQSAHDRLPKNLPPQNNGQKNGSNPQCLFEYNKVLSVFLWCPKRCERTTS